MAAALSVFAIVKLPLFNALVAVAGSLTTAPVGKLVKIPDVFVIVLILAVGTLVRSIVAKLVVTKLPVLIVVNVSLALNPATDDTSSVDVEGITTVFNAGTLLNAVA